MRIKTPPLNSSYDYLEAAFSVLKKGAERYVVLLAFDPESLLLVPVGVGEVVDVDPVLYPGSETAEEKEAGVLIVQTQFGGVNLRSLNYLAYAIVASDQYGLLTEYVRGMEESPENEASHLAALIAGLGL